MQEDDCYYVGYFSKTIGTKGEIALNLDVDDIEPYMQLKSLMVKINERDHQLVPFFIDALSHQSRNVLRLAIKNVTDAHSAKSLVGKSVYLPLTMLPKLNDHQFYFHEIIGYKAVDAEKGEIGTIKDVLDHPSQQLLQIFTEVEKEILLPVNDAFVGKVDREQKILHLICPEGLIELYTS